MLKLWNWNCRSWWNRQTGTLLHGFSCTIVSKTNDVGLQIFRITGVSRRICEKTQRVLLGEQLDVMHTAVFRRQLRGHQDRNKAGSVFFKRDDFFKDGLGRDSGPDAVMLGQSANEIERPAPDYWIAAFDSCEIKGRDAVRSGARVD